MDIEKLMEEYFKWLREGTHLLKVGEYYEITTPFLDPMNDCLQIYVKQEGKDIYFTDDGIILYFLTSSGVKLTPKRKKQIEAIARQFGVQVSNSELIAKATSKNFPEQKLLFMQAMLRISDMYMTSQSKVSSFFKEDVKAFFDANEIYASPDVSLAGKSGYRYIYDYLFSPTKGRPERLCNVINNPNKSNINSALFSWLDTKDVRNKDSQFILLLNDENHVSNEAVEAATNYDVKTICWSQRNTKDNLDLLRIA